MPRLKPIVASTPEEPASALGLSALEAREAHAEIAKRAGTSRTRVNAILNDDLDHVSSDLLVRILAGLGYRVRISVVKSDTAA